MRVVSWNMGMANRRQRTPGLHDQAWHYLLGLGPDLAFVQEALPPPWVRNEGTLIHGPFRQWGSAIFSPRFPLGRYRLPERSNLHAFGSYLAYGLVSLPDGADVFVTSVHAPSRVATEAQIGNLDRAEVKRPSAEGLRVNDVVFAGLDEVMRGRQFLVAGDWNTGRSQSSERGRTAGAEFFDRARDRGWVECLPERGDEERTFFGRSDHPYQDDHLFCDPTRAESLERVWVVPMAATDLGLSDHAPLVGDFKMLTISMVSLEK